MLHLPDSLVIANTKGGVGKTTISAHLAVSAAVSGREVVAVDLDPQGHLTAELGIDSQNSDGGRGLVAMAMGLTTKPRLVQTARERLRCLPGGPGTAQLVGVARQQRGEHGLREVLLEALRPISATGALLVIDTQGAADSPLVRVAVEIARWALIPTRTDTHSIAGLLQVLDILGPETADPAGVLLFQVNPRATRRLARLREQLAELLQDRAPVLTTTIRHADQAQQEATERGLVVAEYAALTTRSGARSRAARRSALRLAADYHSLASELDGIMREQVAA